MKRLYKITIAYDGSEYSGWQVQPNATSIQEVLQDAFEILFKEKVLVTGAGRTDAGVHAKGQVAHFSVDEELDLHRFLVSINGLLPKDIRIKKIEKPPSDFHSRYSAKRKTYHYHLHLDRIHDPFTRKHSLHVMKKLDIELLKGAAQKFIGTHDFTSFANDASRGCAANKPVKTIFRLDVVEEPHGIRLEFEGDGFLYKMVRNITGTLLSVATGKLPLAQLDAIFEAKDRRKAPMAAPAHGLFLIHIDY